MPSTLLLDRSAWDLVLDASGNIALAGEPYATAQDVASAVRTFIGECWYDTFQGMPYWDRVLGQLPSLTYLKSELVRVALTVPNVAEAKAVVISFDGRVLSGQIQITDNSGRVVLSTFTTSSATDDITLPESSPGQDLIPIPPPPIGDEPVLLVSAGQGLSAQAGKFLRVR